MGYGKDIRIGVSYLRLYKGWLSLNFTLLIVGTFVEGLSISMLIPVIQSIEGTKGGNFFSDYAQRFFEWAGLDYDFGNIIVFFGLLMLFKYGLMYGQVAASRVMSALVICELRELAFRNLMRLPLGFFYKQKIGDLIATLYTSSINAGSVFQNFVQMSIGVLFCIVYIILNILISLPLSIAACFVALPLYFLIFPRFRIGRVQGEEEKRITDQLSSFIMDKFAGIKTLKLFSNEIVHVEEFNALARAFRRLQIKIQNNRILADLSLEPAVTVLIIVLLFVSVTILHLSIAPLVTFFYIFSRMIPKLKQINTNYIQSMNMVPHFSKIQSLINCADKSYLSEGKVSIRRIEEGIRFDNVHFKYPDTDSYALNAINLFIEKGEITAVVGISGGGKTTLVDLLVRHHDPVAGHIYVDDANLKEIRIRDWHLLIGMVDQDPYLFNDTIYRNILYGKPNAKQEDVFEAVRLANAHKFIDELPEKYETIVGERGMNLSGGQKQRIALARALIKDPEILILDEATSSLDSESEMLIQQSIENLSGKKTMVIVAHRLSTIKHAAKIIVIERGQIVEQGTPEQLLEEGKIYKYFHALQFGKDRR